MNKKAERRKKTKEKIENSKSLKERVEAIEQFLNIEVQK